MSTPPPLSPHLQTYRLPFTAWLSVLHRGTGIFLGLSLPLLAWAFHSLSMGEGAFNLFLGYARHPVAYLFWVGWSFCLIYHGCNGLRHLCWDIGWGFSKTQIKISAYVVLLSAVLLTAMLWAWVVWR